MISQFRNAIFSPPEYDDDRAISRHIKPRWWPPRWGKGVTWVKDCGCCSSASSSVSGIASCCPGMPTVVHVTFSNTGACACLDGQTFALTYAGGIWFSPSIGCGHNVQISMACGAACGGGPGTGCLGFCMAINDLSGNSCNWSTKFPNAGCTCTPLNMVFPMVMVQNALGVCNCTFGNHINATVTL